MKYCNCNENFRLSHLQKSKNLDIYSRTSELVIAFINILKKKRKNFNLFSLVKSKIQQESSKLLKHVVFNKGKHLV